MLIASFALDVIHNFAILKCHAFQFVRTEVVTDIAMFDSGATGFDGFTVTEDNLHHSSSGTGTK
jgi:hypothetical protein